MKRSLLILCLLTCLQVNAQTPQWNWARSAACATFYEHIARDPSGNLVLTGGFASATMDLGGTILNSVSGYDGFVAKYDAGGNLLWAKSFGGAFEELGEDIVADAIGNIYVTGYFSSDSVKFGSITLYKSSGSLNDGFIAKLDAAGNYIWVKAIRNFDVMMEGIATDGTNVYVTGDFGGISLVYDTLTASPAPGGTNVFLLKVDPSGNGLWIRNSGGSNGHEAQGICTDVAGNILISGKFRNSSTFGSYTVSTPSSNAHIYLAKYNSSGTALWAREFGSTGFNWGKAVKCDPSTNIFLTGSFGGTDISFDSFTLSNSDVSSEDMMLVKLDPSGNTLWARSAGGSDYDHGHGLSIGSDGKAYVCGSYRSAIANFSGTAITNAGGSSTTEDGFIAKYDTDGTFLWVEHVGGGNLDWIADVTTVGTNNVFVTGHFTSPSIALGAATLTNGNLFIAKISESAIGIEEQSEAQLLIFPNPSGGKFSIRHPMISNGELSILDPAGRCVFKDELSAGNQHIVDLNRLCAGLYQLQLRSGDVVYARKIIIGCD